LGPPEQGFLRKGRFRGCLQTLQSDQGTNRPWQNRANSENHSTNISSARVKIVVPPRADLGHFLQTRRRLLKPADVGLPATGRRRTEGLRREEVANLAGVSVSWYTWLEQGRPINASRDVLNALARTLRLDEIECAHMLALAGHSARVVAVPGRVGVPTGLLRLLGALEPCPAYLIDGRWNVLAWNAGQERLFPRFATIDSPDRNLVWIVFCDLGARALIGDWENEARRVLSQFRAETIGLADDLDHQALVGRLQVASPEFAEWWPRHDVGGFAEHVRTFHHPLAGELRLLIEQLIPAGEGDLRLIVHVGLEGDDSLDRLSACPSD
jgi:transcriptional regulator with XRE-family HTH domain